MLAAQVATALGSLSATVLFAQTLSENDYGIYRYVISVGMLLSFLTLSGLPQAVLQASSRGNKSLYNESFKISIKYAAPHSLIALILGGYYFLNENLVLATGLFFIALFQPIIIQFNNTLSFLHGNKDFKSAALYRFLRSILVPLTSIITLFITENIIYLLGVYFLSQGLISLLGFLFHKKENKAHISPQERKKYLFFAKNTSVRNLLAGFSLKIDEIIVFQSLGAVELAILFISTIVPEQIRGALKSLNTLLIPKYTLHENLKSLKKNIPARSLQLFLVFATISASLIITTPFVYEILFPNYEQAIIYSQLLALMIPASLYVIPMSALQVQQKEKELYLFEISTSAVQLLLSIYLIFTLGLLGAVIARVSGQYTKMCFAYLFLYMAKDNAK